MYGTPACDGALVACLRESYGVSASRIERLRLGNDADALTFRVEATDRRAYFLKLRRGLPSELCIAVPRFLRDAGIQQVIAPLPTRTPAPWGIVGEFTALLYPYVQGRSGFVRGLSLDQWSEFGTALARIHALQPPAELAQQLPRERFVLAPRWLASVRAVLAGQHEDDRQDEAARDLTAFLKERREEIRTLLDRQDALGRALRHRSPSFVLCHADIHVGNVLIDEQERVHLVDWDQPILAPRECDLMLVIGPAISGFLPGSPEEAAFFGAYGETAVDPLALTYYRYERATSDIGEYAREVYWMPEADDEARRSAAHGLKSLFQPGQIVDAAVQSEATLPP